MMAMVLMIRGGKMILGVCGEHLLYRHQPVPRGKGAGLIFSNFAME